MVGGFAGGMPRADLVACFLFPVHRHGSLHALVGWGAKLFVLLCTAYTGRFLSLKELRFVMRCLLVQCGGEHSLGLVHAVATAAFRSH